MWIPRISLRAVSAGLVSAGILTYAQLLTGGDKWVHHGGIPFRWYHDHDVGPPFASVDAGYLAVDTVVCVLLLALAVAATEVVARRRHAKRAYSLAALAIAATAVSVGIALNLYQRESTTACWSGFPFRWYVARFDRTAPYMHVSQSYLVLSANILLLCLIVVSCLWFDRRTLGHEESTAA